MRDRLLTLIGLALFVALVTVPFWPRLTGYRRSATAPDLLLPVNAAQCVAPAGYMRASHMRLLLSWREDVVRHGQRRYVAFNGKVYEKSLTGTCLGCHNKTEFCDRCHIYAGVSAPSCWNCHSQPQTAVARRMP